MRDRYTMDRLGRCQRTLNEYCIHHTIIDGNQCLHKETTIMLPISKMAAAVQPSATLAAGAKAKQLKTEGKIVYDFSLGEPDFTTPKHICEAAYKAMLDGHTHYTAASGIAELRGAIARWYKRNYGYEFSPEQVIVSNGAKHSLHNALAATVGPGD